MKVQRKWEFNNHRMISMYKFDAFLRIEKAVSQYPNLIEDFTS